MFAQPGLVTTRACLLCGARQHHEVFDEFGVAILQCRDCHHIFSSFAGHVHYDGFWGSEVEAGEHAYWSRARARMYRDFIARFVTGRAGRLLDMGCGLGYFLKEMSPDRGWRSQGCEISPAAVRYTRTQLGLTNVICSPLASASYPPGSFDIITLWDVLDHLLDPDPVLRRCHVLLKESGFCFIRVPNVSMHLPRARLKKLVWGMQPGLTYLQARDHFHHYSMSSLGRLLRRNGFAEIEFTHLRPVEGLAGWERGITRAARAGWYQAVRGLAVLSGGRLNYDNLFVVARRSAASPCG